MRMNTMHPTVPPCPALDRHLHARRAQLLIKRMLDIVVAANLLVILAPLLLIVAAGIRLDSPGPALFAQRRWGLGGRVFICYKFRSMRTMSFEDGHPPPTDGRLAKCVDDPRLTRLGGLLRRTSIDELPQLWNVVRGDMSLVGPRPLMIHMLEPYPDIRELRCRVRPGITGLWQVHERGNNTHVSAMWPYDLEYLERVGLALDADILARTVRVVLRGDGAV